MQRTGNRFFWTNYLFSSYIFHNIQKKSKGANAKCFSMKFWFVFLGQHFSCLKRCRGRIQISEDKVHNTWKRLLSVLRLNGVRKLFLGGQFWMFVKIQREVWAKREKKPNNDSILRTVVPYLWWITAFFSFLFAFCMIRSLLVSMVDMLCFHSVCLASNQKGFKTINCGFYMYLT